MVYETVVIIYCCSSVLASKLFSVVVPVCDSNGQVF